MYVLLSTNGNPYYEQYWPIAKKMWRAFGYDPMLISVGKRHPEASYHYDHDPTPHAAQFARYFTATKLNYGLAMISDIDVIPLSESYFSNIKQVALSMHETRVIFTTSDWMKIGEVPSASYTVAKGKIYAQILESTKEETFDEFMKRMTAIYGSPDRQVILEEVAFYNMFMSAKIFYAIYLLRGCDEKNRILNRIDRSHFFYDKRQIKENNYIDAHCPNNRLFDFSKCSTILDVLDIIQAGNNT
jgi:hypothetical protein